MPAAPDAVPLVILTGFLGAGKTTVLNRVLGAQHHRRVAVMVNELGRIDIDAGLIRARAGDVVELAGGCVCHQVGVQRELFAALEEVVARSRPDIVVLETTGIAEPGAIVRGLARLARGDGDGDGDEDEDEDEDEDGDGKRRHAVAKVVGVVTVVDAEAGARQLERHEEARDQVEAADRILMSKTDVATPAALADLHRRLRAMNPAATRASFPPGDAGTAALVPWLLATSRRADRAGAGGGGQRGHRHHQLAAAAYVDPAPLVGEALLLVCDELGDRLVRAKGWVHLAGEPRRAFLERAGDRTNLTLGPPWGDDARETRLVLIGEGLDEAALHPLLWACRAG